MATAVAPPPPAHPHGFLLHQSSHHVQQPQQAQPVQQAVAKPSPSDPFYGHEATARICARFIRHVFNCPSDSNQTPVPGQKATESTVSLARFIAYAFHRTRLPTSVAFHALFLLARLKARYPSASCAFGHRLFLTSFMLSSKVICDDTYSNKSWAIVGQGFYDLRDVNLMEREMIHYLSWDLTIPASDLETFTTKVTAEYKRGVPKTPYVFVRDTSRENDHFGKGQIEEKQTPAVELPKKHQLPHIKTSQFHPTAPSNVASPNDPAPPYSVYPPEDPNSPYSDTSSNSSRGSSPMSPGPQTPPDEGVSAPSTPGGKPVPISFVSSHDVKLGAGGAPQIVDPNHPTWLKPAVW